MGEQVKTTRKSGVSRKFLPVPLLLVFLFVSGAFPQTILEPKLVGSWIGGEDFGEFIYHKTEELGRYLSENPDGKIVAKLCSADAMALALVQSNGFAFRFPFYARTIGVPESSLYFARSSRCGRRSEQYWFVPKNQNVVYDEIFPVTKVRVTRLMESYFENPASRTAKEEFESNVSMFVEELEKNPTARGFIIQNLKTRSRYINQANKMIGRSAVAKHRIQLIKKKLYETDFPEFMIVTIDP